jgi:ubiquinone/menaquinone biosynthesis C-methylase UbiE
MSSAQHPASEAALRAARMYDDYHVPAMFRPWAGVLLERAALQPGERVLDLACGSGIVARLAAAQVGSQGQVTALDLNPAMLDVARSHDSEAPGIAWTHGSALDLPFADAAFDAVLCQQGFQFFPDPARALAEIRRVLSPGGRVLLLVSQAIERNPLYHRLNEAMLARTGIPAYAAPFTLGQPGRLEELLSDAQFRDISAESAELTVRFPSPERFVALSVQGAAAALPQWTALPEAERAALSAGMQRDVANWISAHTEDRMLVDVMQVYIARAIR